MGPNVPTGREARAAWQALSPEGRQAAWAAAKGGYSPGDPGLGLAAAGHARRRIRTLRVVLGLVPVVLLVMVFGLMVAAFVSHSARAFFVLAPVLLVGYVVAMVLVRIRIARYRGMYNSATLAVEAAQAGMAVAADPGAWQQNAYQSEFTVPYHAGVRIEPHAQAPSPADPARAGTHRIRVARGPVLVQYALVSFFLLVIWLAVAVLAQRPAELAPLMFTVLAIAVLYTLLALTNVLLTFPLLRDPTVLRLDPDGWSQPPVGTGGRWAGVREIRVRSFAASSRRPVRAVVLMVDDAQAQIAAVPATRRWIARRAVRRYGSPIVVPATPRTMPAPELVALLGRYTDAPVAWG